jgi:hypothetical protein
MRIELISRHSWSGDVTPETIEPIVDRIRRTLTGPYVWVSFNSGFDPESDLGIELLTGLTLHTITITTHEERVAARFSDTSPYAISFDTGETRVRFDGDRIMVVTTTPSGNRVVWKFCPQPENE